MIARENMTNKQSPEYIRVRTKIVKTIKESLDHYQITNQMCSILADSILEIKGLAILSDEQNKPELPDYYYKEPSIYFSGCASMANKMLAENFKKVV